MPVNRHPLHGSLTIPDAVSMIFITFNKKPERLGNTPLRQFGPVFDNAHPRFSLLANYILFLINTFYCIYSIAFLVRGNCFWAGYLWARAKVSGRMLRVSSQPSDRTVTRRAVKTGRCHLDEGWQGSRYSLLADNRDTFPLGNLEEVCRYAGR